MAKKIFRSEGFIVVELDGVNLRRIPIANFSYLFVGTDIHMTNEITKANYTEQTDLLENEAGSAIGDEAAVTAYLDALQATLGTSAVTSQVPASITVVTLKIANTNRKTCEIVNSGASVLFVKKGSVATLTDWSHRLTQFDTYKIDDYSGIITGIWDVAAGDAKVTETT